MKKVILASVASFIVGAMVEKKFGVFEKITGIVKKFSEKAEDCAEELTEKIS